METFINIIWFILTIGIGTLIYRFIYRRFIIIHFGLKGIVTFFISVYLVTGFVIGTLLGKLWFLEAVTY